MIEISDLTSRKQIIDNIYKLIYNFSSDVYLINVDGRSLGNVSINEAYNFVKNLPYKEDLNGEFLGRILKIWKLYTNKYLSGFDCKKKSLFLGCYAKVNDIPFKFKVVSSNKNKEPHHIFPVFYLNNNEVPVDATYWYYRFGKIDYPVYNMEVY